MIEFTLRQATEDDLPFLFKVSIEAMSPVDKALNPGKVYDKAERFAQYQAKFIPEKIQVIVCAGVDVGRLRVVRSNESIYVGGLQLLPEYQNKGIGAAVLLDLIEESKKSGLPITLEVHDVNTNALTFYRKLGFEKSGQTDTQTLLRFVPTIGTVFTTPHF